ncbi:MAG: hypothetical protein IJN00_02040, partial [Clostridia bacterium]|nr:hypothetical protein [Clostridia bacterium]
MKRHFLFAAALMLALLAAPLGALALPGASVALPVSVEEQGTLPAQKQTYALRLAAVSPGAPLPPGAENGMFMLYLQGSDEEEFPLIEFSQPGVYQYTISQIPGENGQCTYDPAEYRVTVYAVLDNSGEMAVSAAIYGQQSSEKLPRATFI